VAVATDICPQNLFGGFAIFGFGFGFEGLFPFNRLSAFVPFDGLPPMTFRKTKSPLPPETV
jgi:hypothetical protein